MPSKVQVVILQYNSSDLTTRCLDSVSKLDYDNFQVMVVDNKSEPEHLEKIKNKVLNLGAKYFLIEAPENKGYAAGNNLGIKYGLEKGAEYIFILNNDTIAPPDALARLVKRAGEDDFIGIVAPALDESEKMAYGGKIKWLKPELGHNYQFDKPEIGENVWDNKIFISGAAMLVKKKVFDKIGLLDERYFLYFEDADFSMRAANAGFKLIVYPEISVAHETSGTTKKLGSPLLLRYHYRNALLFNFKFGPIWAKILLPFWSLWIIIKQTVKMIFIPSRRLTSKEILYGVLDFYRRKYGKID